MTAITSTHTSIDSTEYPQDRSKNDDTSKADRLRQKTTELYNEMVFDTGPPLYGFERESLIALEMAFDKAKEFDPQNYSRLQTIIDTISLLPLSQRVPIFNRLVLPYRNEFSLDSFETTIEEANSFTKGYARIKAMEKELPFSRDINNEIHDASLSKLILDFVGKPSLLTPKINAEISNNVSLLQYVENVLLHRGPGEMQPREEKLRTLEKMGYLKMNCIRTEIESITEITTTLILEEMIKK